MTSPPLVSVFCPTYNHQDFIKQCLDGILKQQTSFDFEVFVQDDASTDKNIQIIDEYCLKDPRIIPIINKENYFSKGKNINEHFFKNARGKYFAICEGDDYWTDPYKLQKQVDFLEANDDYGLVYTDLNFLYNDTGKLREGIYRSGYFPEYSLETFLIAGGYLAPCTWLIRKSTLPENLLLNSTDGSFELALLIWTKHKIKFLEDVTAVYRIREGSASYPQSLNKKYQREKELNNIKRDYCIKNNHSAELLKAVDDYYVYSLNTLFKRYLVNATPEDKKEWNEFVHNSEFNEYPIIMALSEEVRNISSGIEYRSGRTILVPFVFIRKAVRKVLRIFGII